MFKRSARGERGFTMIEMMVVLIIIAVLMGVGIKFYSGYIDRAKVTKARGEVTTMAAALDAYYAEHSDTGYPSKMEDAGIDASLKNPWGRAYDYTRDSTDAHKYTLTAKDAKDNTRVEAKGDHGSSEITVTYTPSTP